MNCLRTIIIIMLLVLGWNGIAYTQNLKLKATALGSGAERGQSSSFILTNTIGQPLAGTGGSSSVMGSYGFLPVARGLSFGSIRGHMFADLDGDSLQDEGEPSLIGWKLYLNGTTTDSVLTDSSGNYVFTGLLPGSYTVTEFVELGWTYTLPASGSYSVTIGIGEDVSAEDFANFKLGYISGSKFSDLNNNGERDSIEYGLSGWTIVLARNEVEIDSTVTDVAGNYSFMNVGPGFYTISERPQDTWVQTYPLPPGIYSFQMYSNDSVNNKVFGNYQALENSITLRAFKDNDGNLASTSDQSSKVWRMMLYKDSVSVQTLLVDTTASSFTIDSVFPGTYIAVEADSSGWVHKGIQINSSLKTTSANADTFIMNVSDAKTVTFLNTWPNTVVIRKFKDIDGNFATANDRSPKKWNLKLYRGTINPQNLVASATSAESLVVTHGEGDLYQAIETDSSGWTHVGTIFDGTGAEGGENYVQFSMPTGGETHYIDFVNTHLGQITVSKFLDQDGDFRTTGDRTSKKWGMKLYKDSVSLSSIVDSVVSSETFTVNNLPEGLYYAVETDSGLPWSHIATVLDEQNLAGGDNMITINLVGGQSRIARFINFNRNRPKLWTAAQDCEWFKAGNWDPPGVPIPGDTIIVPDSAKCALVIPPGATLGTISIALGESVKVQGGSTLIVKGDINITGTLSADEGDSSNIIVGGNWSAPGTFNAGQSTVIFTGDEDQTIESNGQPFYNLQIGGVNPDTLAKMFGKSRLKSGKLSTLPVVKTSGNVTVDEFLDLQTDVDAQGDTLFIKNSFWNAVEGGGSIIRGTMQRTFAPADTHMYKFQSSQTFIKFNSAVLTPSDITVTAYPDTNPSDFGSIWEIVPSTVDTVTNTVTANVNHFSKWSVGTTRPNRIVPGNQKLTLDPPVVNRVYVIDPKGGGQFDAELSLQYDQTEVATDTPEDSLTLYRLVGVVTASSLSKGWNIVSVPVIVSDSLKSSLYPTASSVAYTFIPGAGYQIKDTLKNGVGYWIKFPSSQTTAVFGGQRLADTVNLLKGWQQFGSLSSTISVDSVNLKTIPPNLISAVIYSYSGSYQQASSISPGKGYWIKLSAPGKLVMSASGSIGKKAPAADPLTGLSTLTIDDASGASQTLYFGDTREGMSVDVYELPPVPPTPIFDARFGTGRMVEVAESKQKRDIPILLSSAVYPLTVHWNINPQSISTSLKIGEKRILLEKNGSIQLKEPAVAGAGDISSQSPLALSLGTEPLPKQYSLEQNYPNPFNPNTQITYSLPVNSHVTLMIYNILGQQVATLTDEVQDAGYKTVEWSSSNDAGMTVASGVYYYRIEATSLSDPNKTFRQVRKMVLLK